MSIRVDPVEAIHRKFVTLLFCASVAVLFVVSGSAWHHMSGPIAHLVTPLGIFIAAIGAFGRLWCSSYIGGNKNSCLVTVGPYSLTRNPLYLFSFIGGLGVAITTETLTIPIVFALWFVVYHRRVIAGEEALLQSRYGRDFEAYSRRVPRFWPKFAGYVEPERWELGPPAVRRSLTEVVWFVAMAVVLHVVHDLRSAGERIFTLY